MKSSVTKAFRQKLDQLPTSIQKQAAAKALVLRTQAQKREKPKNA